MVKDDLYEIINKLTTMAAEPGDTDLEKPWSWGSYDREGIRFAFFRTYEELQELAVKLEAERLNLGLPLKSAQRILGQYHLAFRDLQAVLLGVSSDLENVPPAQGDWSIRDVLAHIIQANVGFYVIVRYALERHRCTEMRPVEISDEAWEDISGLDEAAYTDLMEGSLGNLMQFHRDHHQRILDEFSEISEEELHLGSKYWEEEEMSLRFRLHRFDSHMQQPTIQVEKALSEFGQVPNEAERLMRLLYGTLAHCENKTIGLPEVGEALRREVVNSMRARMDEIWSVLQLN